MLREALFEILKITKEEEKKLYTMGSDGTVYCDKERIGWIRIDTVIENVITFSYIPYPLDKEKKGVLTGTINLEDYKPTGNESAEIIK